MFTSVWTNRRSCLVTAALSYMTSLDSVEVWPVPFHNCVGIPISCLLTVDLRIKLWTQPTLDSTNAPQLELLNFIDVNRNSINIWSSKIFNNQLYFYISDPSMTWVLAWGFHVTLTLVSLPIFLSNDDLGPVWLLPLFAVAKIKCRYLSKY